MQPLILGAGGLVGQALARRLPDAYASRDRLDQGCMWGESHREVYLAAGRVGGIGTNSDQPVDMLDDNLRIQQWVIRAASVTGSKLCFLGSSCIYPRNAPQPIPESALMTGPLEPTNSAYALAKLCGLEMCRAYAKQYGLRFVALMPCNLYGPGRPNDTHVINMLMRKIHDAKMTCAPSVTVWGTGRPLREFMHVDDLAEAAVYFMNLPEAEGQLINVGTGAEISIHGLATLIAEIVGYDGDVAFDHTKPDGTPRKVLDVSKAAGMGWRAKIPLTEGLERTYRWYVENGCWP